MTRDLMSPMSGKMLLPDNTVMDISQRIVDSSDAIAKKFVTLDHVHNAIHRGQLFRAWRRNDVAAGGNAYVRIVTGTRPVHFQERDFVASAGEWIIRLIENPTVSGGTVIPIYNSNRISANTPTMQLFHSPDTPTGGTTIDEIYIPATTAGTPSAMQKKDIYEWILAPSSVYVFNWNNIGGQTRTMHVNWVFYELPPS